MRVIRQQCLDAFKNSVIATIPPLTFGTLYQLALALEYAGDDPNSPESKWLRAVEADPGYQEFVKEFGALFLAPAGFATTEYETTKTSSGR